MTRRLIAVSLVLAAINAVLLALGTLPLSLLEREVNGYIEERAM